jgi:hypothetical protein
MSDGLRKVSKLGVADGAPIEAHHVSHIVDTLNGDAICDVKFCGSLTIDGSTYNSDTVYSNNFQASTALTVKGSTSPQLIFLDKNSSNNIRFRDAGGTVNRGYVGFNGDDFIINNQQGTGTVSIYNINEALTIDTSQNISIPNGGLTVTTGIITGNGSGLTNLNLSGVDGSGLTNLNLNGMDGSGLTNVSSGGPTFGLNDQIPFVNNDTNDYDYSSKLTYNNLTLFANSTAANSPGIQVDKINSTNNTKIFGGSLSGALDGVNWVIDRVGTTGLVLQTTTNKSIMLATNNSVNNGKVLQLKTSGDVEIGQAYNSADLDARLGVVGAGSDGNTTNLLLKNSSDTELFRVKNNGQLNIISNDDRPFQIKDSNNPGNSTSYISFRNSSDAEQSIIGIDSDSNIRLNQVGNTPPWKGLKILRSDSSVLIDQGLTVSAGGSDITGASSFSTTLSVGGKLTVSSGGALIKGGATINGTDNPLTISSDQASADAKCYIKFESNESGTAGYVGNYNNSDDVMEIISGKSNGATLKVGSFVESDKKLKVTSGGADITGASSFSSTLSTGGKLTVTNGGARIDGNSNFEDNLTIGYGDEDYNSNDLKFTATSTAPEKHIIQSFYRGSATDGMGAGANKELKSDETSTNSGTNNYAKLSVNGTIKADGYFGTSDERLKNLIGNYNPGEALNTLNKITPKLFKWNELSHASGMTDFGFFAQEVEEVFPFGVITSKTDNFEDQRSINPIAMVALASAAIKDLSKENNILKDKNRELEDRLKLIEEKLGL